MSLAIGFEEAKANQIKSEGMAGTKGAVLLTPFFRFRDNADMPHASLSQREPGRYSCAHFHRNDQFQVVVDGKGKLGRHDLTPYNIHFARAYTPYGPLISDADTGLTFFVMRAHFDAGSQRLPKELDQLRRAPNRQPWQIKRQVSLPRLQSVTGVNLMLQEVPGMKDDHGLAAYALSMSPNAEGLAPDPSEGDGQYLVVVNGSLLHDGKEHKAPALVFVFSTDSQFEIHSGPHGLGALVLNFPRVKSNVGHGETHSASGGVKKWQCALCNFAYDEAKGMPDEGIPAGTPWEDVPDTWSCPDCGASKSDFQMTDV